MELDQDIKRLYCALWVQSLQRRRINELFKQTAALLPKLGIRPKHLTFGDGYKVTNLCSI
jgi:hypothetical protein